MILKENDDKGIYGGTNTDMLDIFEEGSYFSILQSGVLKETVEVEEKLSRKKYWAG